MRLRLLDRKITPTESTAADAADVESAAPDVESDESVAPEESVDFVESEDSAEDSAELGEPVEEASAEPVESVEDEPEEQPRSRWPRLVAVLLVAALLLAAAATVLGVLFGQAEGRAADRRTASTTAERVASQLLTLGYTNSPDTIGHLLDDSTGPLRTQLTALSSTLTTLLKQGQVASDGTVGASAVERIDADTAVVLVAAEAVVKNTEIPNGQRRAYRIAVTLQRQDDRWLASAVDFVG